MIPQAVAAGNHEYRDAVAADGSETRELGPGWTPHHSLPANGAPGAEATSYVFDYQGARFVVLDGTSAIDLGTMDSQTAWLERVLSESTARWTIVLMHQPIFTCARPNDTARPEGRLEADLRTPQGRSGPAGPRPLLRSRLQRGRSRRLSYSIRRGPAGGPGLSGVGGRVQDVRAERPRRRAAGSRRREHRTLSGHRRRRRPYRLPGFHRRRRSLRRLFPEARGGWPQSAGRNGRDIARRPPLRRRGRSPTTGPARPRSRTDEKGGACGAPSAPKRQTGRIRPCRWRPRSGRWNGRSGPWRSRRPACSADPCANACAVRPASWARRSPAVRRSCW